MYHLPGFIVLRSPMNFASSTPSHVDSSPSIHIFPSRRLAFFISSELLLTILVQNYLSPFRNGLPSMPTKFRHAEIWRVDLKQAARVSFEKALEWDAFVTRGLISLRQSSFFWTQVGLGAIENLAIFLLHAALNSDIHDYSASCTLEYLRGYVNQMQEVLGGYVG
ncbi:hypothetical protein N7520_000765 [Penicillium odoratum]|uniref:uncharacterized protein n=1 Tax=Penicillium odoratum TaxID=1167516 RepID=UPI0025487438|nr:uncharacterized protein N7520_000765 [Penicillium odoratum]KAJ5777519.1 hypothetical protein N7520_000765 [Penicillium odoratum]